jgi:hypothetical protein
MKKIAAVLVPLALMVTALGCRKPNYGPGCDAAVALVSPFAEMGLPVAEGRVCKSEAKVTEVRYLSGAKADYEASFEQGLTGAGYAKEKCRELACDFKKGDQKVTVQVMESKLWRTVVVRTN